jgi:TonB family protein
MRIRVAVALVVVPFIASPQAATPQPQPVLRVGIGNGVTAPRLEYKREPAYTEEAQRARLQGSVVLNFVVRADGTLSDFRVERSLGLGLDENAIEAVKEWKFKPGEKDGKPVAVSIGAIVNYRLEDAIGILKNSQMTWRLGSAVFGVPEGASRPVFLEANGEAPEGHLSVTVLLVINEQGNPVTIHVPRLGAGLAEATHLGNSPTI